jgi:tetratricopeptide (TPR) repeat protein
MARAAIFLMLVCLNSPIFSSEPPKSTFNASNSDDVKQAIEYLKGLRSSKPDDPGIRRELAKAYNFYAIHLAQTDLDMAIDYMQRATYEDSSHQEYVRSLSVLYFRRGQKNYLQKEVAKAINDFKNAIRVFPENSEALVALGDIFYAEGQFEEASRYWSKAQRLGGYQKEIAQRLSRLQKDLENAKSFKKRETQNFVFMFDEKLNEFQFGNMENILNEVYVKVGQDFNYFPTYRIAVQVYAADQYRKEIEPTPNVVGMYDGRIKLPAFTKENEADYRRIVFHEYTHAIVYDLSGGKAPRWLHEGLATYQDPGFHLNTGFLAYLYRNNGLVNIEDLDSCLLDKQNINRVSAGYYEANSLVKYFFSRYNYWHMKNILAMLKEGETTDNAFRKEIYVGLADFFKMWREDTFRNLQ